LIDFSGETLLKLPHAGCSNESFFSEGWFLEKPVVCGAVADSG
jgi:hypothetical protein